MTSGDPDSATAPDAFDVQRALAVIAEPTRFRVVQLLAESPRTVGEVADAIGALQPQTTKHLQALEAAGVVQVHPLGRRRVVSLRREAPAAIAEWFGALAAQHPSDAALRDYGSAIAEADGRAYTVELTRTLEAPVAAVWRAWTEAGLASHWWAPEHFIVVSCRIGEHVGDPVEVVLGEADGATYPASGTVLVRDPERRFRFELSPLSADGTAMFPAVLDVEFTERDGATTELHMTIEVGSATPGSEPAHAGVELGWSQNLDRLAALLA